MISALNQFSDNIKRTRELGVLAAAVRSMTTPAVDVSDIWRSQIVLAVSALDQFVHEIARLGMIEAAKGTRPKTDAYLRFELPLDHLESISSGVPIEAQIDQAVRTKHSWVSFQDPDKIAGAVRLISTQKLWESVGVNLGISADDVKARLRIIVDRRNKIAHEADIDPANPGFRWPISDVLVNEAISFVENVVGAIYAVAV